MLGIKNISLKKAEWAVHFDRVSKGSYELGFMGWSSCVLDASFILEVFRNKDDASNKSNWENEKYKECLDQANFTINELKKKELLIEAENILMDEMPIIPLCFVNKRFAKNPRLNGENLSSLQFIDFKTAYFSSKTIISFRLKRALLVEPTGAFSKIFFSISSASCGFPLSSSRVASFP